MFIILGVLSLSRCFLLTSNLKLFANYRRFFKYSFLFLAEKKKSSQLTTLKIMEGSLLQGKIDIHRGIVVNSMENMCKEDEEFENKLESSLRKWKDDHIRGIWFHISVPQINWIPVLIKKGFKIHHARNELITLCHWLPEKEPYKLPAYPSFLVGAGAVVINDNNQILVVRERYRKVAFWKLPGGHVDQGEDIVDAAIREVLEETSVKTEFVSVISIRSTKKCIFEGCTDMYFVVRLRPLTLDIAKEEDEIEDCKWMDINEYLSHPEVHENNKMFVTQALENEKDGVIMVREDNIHPVTKVPQFIYNIKKKTG